MPPFGMYAIMVPCSPVPRVPVHSRPIAERSHTSQNDVCATRAPWLSEGRKDGSLNAESSVLGNGKTGTKPPEIGQWLAEIGHSPFPSSGRQRASALTRTKNR
jgi:hypothetical protein